jgi:alkylation response protein AidB-like acyl-CoA dehydrogenase
VDFGFSSEQEQLRGVAREFLRAETPVSFARSMMDDRRGLPDATWRKLAELGWLGLIVPEALGGSGLGTLELVIVAEEMGAVVFPGPYFSTVCLGAQAILAAATAEQKQARLGALAAGRHRTTLAVAEETGSWDTVALEARESSGGFVLSGVKLFVPDARSSDSIVVVVRLGTGIGFFDIAASTPGLRVSPMTTVDATRKLDAVELDGVQVAGDSVLAHRALEPSVLDGVIDRAKVALAAEMCGAAAATLDMSVDYAKIRKQFDRPIGTFQAIQHKLADMKVSLENARSLVYYAAWALDSGAADARLAAAMAKAYASDACSRIAGDAIQVHGGIGFTWEHDLHLYFKRVKAGELTFGDAAHNRELVAKLLSL